MALEEYKEATFNDMGLIYVKVSLSLLKKNKPEKSEKFVNQSLEFLDEKLQRPLGNEQPYFEKLKSIFTLISEKRYTADHIKEADEAVKTLDKYIKNSLDKTEGAYYKIFT